MVSVELFEAFARPTEAVVALEPRCDCFAYFKCLFCNLNQAPDNLKFKLNNCAVHLANVILRRIEARIEPVTDLGVLKDRCSVSYFLLEQGYGIQANQAVNFSCQLYYLHRWRQAITLKHKRGIVSDLCS